MILNKDGLLNVGPGKNDDYRVRIDNRDVLGLDIANSGANTDWKFLQMMVVCFYFLTVVQVDPQVFLTG
jgi:hypothetical protein